MSIAAYLSGVMTSYFPPGDWKGDHGGRTREARVKLEKFVLRGNTSHRNVASWAD